MSSLKSGDFLSVDRGSPDKESSGTEGLAEALVLRVQLAFSLVSFFFLQPSASVYGTPATGVESVVSITRWGPQLGERLGFIASIISERYRFAHASFSYLSGSRFFFYDSTRFCR